MLQATMQLNAIDRLLTTLFGWTRVNIAINVVQPYPDHEGVTGQLAPVASYHLPTLSSLLFAMARRS